MRRFNLQMSYWFESYDEAIRHTNLIADYIDYTNAVGCAQVEEYTHVVLPPSIEEGYEML
jgi:hypothetical protein